MQRAELVLEFHGVLFSILLIIFLTITGRRGRTYTALGCVLGTNMGNLLSDMADIYFHGKEGMLAWWMVSAGNFTLYLFQHLLYAAMAVYVYESLREVVPNMKTGWLKIIFSFSGIGIFVLLLTPFTGLCYTIDENNLYHRGPFFLVAVLMGMVCMLLTICQILVYRDKLARTEKYALLVYYAFPMLGLVLQVIWFGYSFMNIGIAISILILVTEALVRDSRVRREQERMILQSRAYLLNSQIKPHFMFNSLAVIQSLVQEDPDTAVEAISHFSRFLRTGMNLKVNDGLIPIQVELDYTRNYLYMEKLRFGDKLNIEYAIQEGIRFDIPFLTLQPIAENAVRHGIRKKKEGGTLNITITQERKEAIIRVTDDGAGFDPEEAFSRGDEKLRMALRDPEHMADSNGIGMVNVEERIRILAGGTMTVESEPGKGTIVTLRLPIHRSFGEKSGMPAKMPD